MKSEKALFVDRLVETFLFEPIESEETDDMVNRTKILVYSILISLSIGSICLLIGLSTTNWIHLKRIRIGLWKVCHLQKDLCFYSIRHVPLILALTSLIFVLVAFFMTIIVYFLDCFFFLARRHFSLILLFASIISAFSSIGSTLIFLYLTEQFSFSFYSMKFSEVCLVAVSIAASYLHGRNDGLSAANLRRTRFEQRRI